ncbi:hypothetical protein ACFLUX_03435 [Chloroflexota bacterium]
MNMLTFRLWLFRVLVIAAGGLLVTSFLLPWWNCWIYEIGLGEASAEIYVTGLWLDYEALGTYIKYLPGAEMPGWFAPAMWTYLGLGIAALLFSLWVKDRNVRLLKINFNLPKLIIGLVGLSYIVVVVVAVIIAAIRTGDFFNMHLIGYTDVVITPGVEESGVEAGLLSGYWMACAAGPLLVILALLRNKIVGKTKRIS